MDVVALLGRLLYVIVFLSAGVFGHLMQTTAMAGYAESKKLPAARPMVLLSGAWIIVGSLMVLLGVWADLGALMLFVFLLGTAFIFHNFWTETDPMARQNEMTQFTKDLGLAGAALLIFVFYGTFGADTVFKSVPQRIAATLRTLAGQQHPLTRTTQVRLTHEQLAALVGTSRETATKTVNELADRGLLRLGRGRITILDRDRLTAEAGD
ncbi:MAG: helix-turn-helix domain-containing protein [Micromonosporaceae bacterium]